MQDINEKINLLVNKISDHEKGILEIKNLLKEIQIKNNSFIDEDEFKKYIEDKKLSRYDDLFCRTSFLLDKYKLKELLNTKFDHDYKSEENDSVNDSNYDITVKMIDILRKQSVKDIVENITEEFDFSVSNEDIESIKENYENLHGLFPITEINTNKIIVGSILNSIKKNIEEPVLAHRANEYESAKEEVIKNIFQEPKVDGEIKEVDNKEKIYYIKQLIKDNNITLIDLIGL